MTCQHNAQSCVIETRRDSPTTIYRVRLCNCCFQRYITVETIFDGEMPKSKKKRVRDYASEKIRREANKEKEMKISNSAKNITSVWKNT